MPSKKSISGQVNPGIILVVSYFVLFAVNALVITLAHGYFPNQLVLGTTNLTQAWAVILTAGKLALINTFAIPFIRQYELRRGKMLTPSDWMIIYFILNFVGIWLITRFPIQFGTGISAWWVAALLAVVLDVVQGVAMMQIEKMRPKNS